MLKSSKYSLLGFCRGLSSITRTLETPARWGLEEHFGVVLAGTRADSFATGAETISCKDLDAHRFPFRRDMLAAYLSMVGEPFVLDRLLASAAPTCASLPP